MGERKVLNKYYPADFDPSKICRRKQSKNQQTKVRTMLPMTIRCNSCGNYMNAGTKFNARKEQVMEETYLGINCFRFYFRCTNCSAEIVKKTDPQNSDYVIEAGATRTRRIEQDDEQRNLETGDGEILKSLENRSLELKREMDVFANLEEIKSMKARRAATVSLDTMLEALKNKDKKRTEEEDEALVKSIFSVPRRRRIHDDDKENDVSVKKFLKIENSDNGKQQPMGGVQFMVRKPVPKEDTDMDPCSGLQSLLQYDTEDEYTLM